MNPRLYCLIVDAGPAAYMKPIFSRWLESPPFFDWTLTLGEKAMAVLQELTGLSDHVMETVAREDRPKLPACNAVLASAGGCSAEQAIVRAGRDTGVPVVQFLDSCYNYTRRFTYDGTRLLPDRVLFVTEKSVQEAQAEGIPRGICDVVGHPAWELCRPLAQSAGRDVLFVGAPVARDYGRSLGYTEIEAWDMLVQTLDERDGWAGNLLYAPHPEQSPDRVPKGVEIVRYDSSMLKTIDTVVGMFSAPLVDAFLATRRCLSLQPAAAGIDMFFLSRQGFLPRIVSREALSKALSSAPTSSAGFADMLRGSNTRLNGCVQRVLAA